MPQATGQSGQSQISLYRPITGQFILINLRRYTNPADQINWDRIGRKISVVPVPASLRCLCCLDSVNRIVLINTVVIGVLLYIKQPHDIPQIYSSKTSKAKTKAQEKRPLWIRYTASWAISYWFSLSSAKTPEFLAAKCGTICSKLRTVILKKLPHPRHLCICFLLQNYKWQTVTLRLSLRNMFSK